MLLVLKIKLMTYLFISTSNIYAGGSPYEWCKFSSSPYFYGIGEIENYARQIFNTRIYVTGT